MAWEHDRFAKEFLKDRRDYLEKDIRICLRSYRSRLTDRMSGKPAPHHAYWPAFMTCLATLELATKLFEGRRNSIGWKEVERFVGMFLRKERPQYDSDVVQILWDGFRNSIAHGGRPAFVMPVGRKNGRPKWRISWAVSEQDELGLMKQTCHRHLDVAPEASHPRTPIRPPWNSPFDHRVYVSLKALKDDIKAAISSYESALHSSSALQKNFMVVIATIYPS